MVRFESFIFNFNLIVKTKQMISTVGQALGVTGDLQPTQVTLPQHDAPEVNLSFSASGVTDNTSQDAKAKAAAAAAAPSG